MLNRQENSKTYLLTISTCDDGLVIQQIKQIFPNLIFKRIAPQIYTLEVNEQNSDEFAELSTYVSNLERPGLYGLNAQQALEVSNISILHSDAFGNLRGNGTIIGIVDTGIEYTNALFKNANNTSRILGIWDQTLEGTPPDEADYGAVYTQEQLNEALATTDPYTVVPSRDEIGHGTFLAGVAAGNDQSGGNEYIGGAPDADLLIVKLKPASEELRQLNAIEPNVPAYQENDIIAGVNFLIQETILKYNSRPLAICLGLGSNRGFHNGTNILEIYLESASLTRNVVIAISAGNEGNAGHHYESTIANKEVQELEINVPDNSTGFVINLWPALPDKIAVSLKSPLGQVVEKIPIIINQTQTFQFNLERTVLNVNYLYPDVRTGGQRIEITLRQPTQGLWTLTIYGESIATGGYNMWLPRNGFVKADTRFLRSTPEVTVQSPGTNVYTLVVGAYDDADDSVYVATSRGPTTEGIIKPDIIAPGVNIQGPALGGGYTTMVGTSVSAAITAAACAILLQWASINQNLPQMNTRIARSILMNGARRLANVNYPNNIEGYGRLDLRTSIANI